MATRIAEGNMRKGFSMGFVKSSIPQNFKKPDVFTSRQQDGIWVEVVASQTGKKPPCESHKQTKTR